MPVRTDGAPSVSSSRMLPYSNSKPTMSRPAPTANPLASRLDGVVAVPTNAVRSAQAGDASVSSATVRTRGLMSLIPNDTILSGMDPRLTAEQELLRRSVREFAESELLPHVMEWDEAQQFPPSLLEKCAELGLMGIQFPEEYGGAAMSAVDYCVCIEELARVDPSVCLSV